MSTTQRQSFNRFELKYWIDSDKQHQLQQYISNFMKQDANSRENDGYRICSLYFDNRDRSAYYEKFDGNFIRNKYRIRFYNENTAKAFFEIKTKQNFFVRKNRQIMEFEPDEIPELKSILSSEDDTVHGPFRFAYRQLKLEPIVWVSYHRTAFVGNHNPKLRVTFDRNLGGVDADGYRFRLGESQAVQLSKWNNPIILEIKFDGHLPYWLEKAIQDLNLQHQSISKYGLCVNRFIFRNWKERQWTHYQSRA